MKFTLNWLLTAFVMTGFASASLDQSENYDLFKRLIEHERSLGSEDSSLALRLIDLIEAREAAQVPFEVEIRDDAQDPVPSEQTAPASTTAAPPSTTCTGSTTSAAPWTVVTPTGSIIVMASQGVTHTYSLNATGTATATSTVVLVVTDQPKPKNAATNLRASWAFTGVTALGGLLTAYML